jgi:hypothetical protein
VSLRRPGPDLLLAAAGLASGALLLGVEAAVEAGQPPAARTLWADFGGGVYLDLFGKLLVGLALVTAWTATGARLARWARPGLRRDAIGVAFAAPFVAAFVLLALDVTPARVWRSAAGPVLVPLRLAVAGTLLLPLALVALGARLRRRART